MTFPALFLADRIGRRTLMIAGSLVMTIALAVTAFSFWSGGTVGALLAAFGLAGGYTLLAFFSAMLFFVSVFGLKETKGKEL